jgi:hydroxymethylpyrimidine pyrophosphatase-like HAD family hydrolase
MTDFLVALDLDGTLLHDDKTLSAFTVDTLCTLSRAGVSIAFVTGRRERIARVVLDQCPVDGWALFNNGTLGVTWPARARCFTHYFPVETIRNVVECLRHVERPPVLLVDPDGTAVDIVMDRCMSDLAVYREYAERHEGYVTVADDVAECASVTRVLGMFLCEPIESMPMLKAHLTTMLGDTIEHRSLDNLAYLEGYRILEIVEPGWTKSRGVCELAAHLSMPRPRILAFGDDANDYDLLAYADESYAPANAIEKARAIAGTVIGSNNDDGVAHALRARFPEAFMGAPSADTV